MKSFVEKENLRNPAALTWNRAVKQNGPSNKWLSALTALVAGLVLQAGLASAQNLLTNPGFETGNTSGWSGVHGSPTLTVETTQVHAGTYACAVTGRTQTYIGIGQSLLGLLTAGQTYNVSAWVMMDGGSSQMMKLTMEQTDGSGTSYIQIDTNTVSPTGWTQLSGQFTYNPSGTVSTLTLYAEVPSSATASFYIDDADFSGGTIVSNPPIYGDSTVDWNNVHQRIDGFGASSAWNGSWTTAQADLLFSTNNNISFSGGTYNGAGLSLLRNHIAYAADTSPNSTPTTVETSIMTMAQARGARVWSTPWTPAAGFKGTNDIYDSGNATGNGINGGHYLGYGHDATNQAYASQLANYVLSMKNMGINLYAISIQNEPDAAVTSYEACQWTNTQFHDFVTNLYAALVAKGVGSTKIILPESENWWPDPHNLMGPAMSDPAVAAEVGIIADHDYVPDNSVGDQTVPAQIIPPSGQATWETEVALLSGSDSSIANGVYWGRRIYQFMTQAQANAYHYWWLTASDNGGLIVSGVPAKRLFVFGQYSRFVRPNFYRIDATSSQPSALISAYRATNSTAFAIVVVNTNAATNVIETFNLTGFTAASVTPWITSASLSLAPQTPVNVTNASFAYEVPAMSVVTFVGQGSLAPASITITNVSYDSTTPAFVLTWNSTSGSTYSVLKTNVLGDSSMNWPMLITGYPTGGALGGPLSYTDTTVTAGTAFYRVSSP